MDNKYLMYYLIICSVDVFVVGYLVQFLDYAYEFIGLNIDSTVWMLVVPTNISVQVFYLTAYFYLNGETYKDRIGSFAATIFFLTMPAVLLLERGDFSIAQSWVGIAYLLLYMTIVIYAFVEWYEDAIPDGDQ